MGGGCEAAAGGRHGAAAAVTEGCLWTGGCREGEWVGGRGGGVVSG